MTAMTAVMQFWAGHFCGHGGLPCTGAVPQCSSFVVNPQGMNLQVEQWVLSSQERTIFGHFIDVEKDRTTEWGQLE